MKNRRNAPPISVRCTLLIRQRTPCSESRAFGWQLPSRTPKPCKVRSCRTPIPFPHKYRKQHCPFRFLHQRMAVCCICSGSCYNPAKFEKQKKCTAYFSTVHIAYQAENALQREPGVRVAITEQNAEAFCKVHSCRTLIPFPHNTRNNVARSGFCTEGWLSAVSVLETSAIRENLKKQKKCTVYFSTVHVACQSENALQREPSVRVAITEQNAEALQGSLLQNTDTIPTQYKKQRCPFRLLHRRTAVCCICSGSCYNQAKFEYAGIESSSC